jgi:DNA-binding MarR family transcriptional regulator|tara:strand:- start:7469 stop:7918 length:450 start_codon:yes stop_codon:yes gene_type:complete
MGLKEDIKQTKFENNKVMAMVNVFYTSNWLRDNCLPVFKKHGILSQHYNILRILRGKYPKAVSPGEIKEVMLDGARDLTRLIDKLVKLGYLNRKLCEHNRRKMEITINQSGLDIIEVISRENAIIYDDFNLTDEEAQQLSDLLDKFRSS